MFDGRGPAFYTTGYFNSYINLKPIAIKAPAAERPQGRAIAVAAVVVAGALVVARAAAAADGRGGVS